MPFSMLLCGMVGFPVWVLIVILLRWPTSSRGGGLRIVMWTPWSNSWRPKSLLVVQKPSSRFYRRLAVSLRARRRDVSSLCTRWSCCSWVSPWTPSQWCNYFLSCPLTAKPLGGCTHYSVLVVDHSSLGRFTGHITSKSFGKRTEEISGASYSSLHNQIWQHSDLCLSNRWIFVSNYLSEYIAAFVTQGPTLDWEVARGVESQRISLCNGVLFQDFVYSSPGKRYLIPHSP